MDISKSSFYYWKNRLNSPSRRTKIFISNILLFKEYHEKYPSHGYRWLNAKIRLDTGLIVSDAYAHKCCKTAGIKSKSKHYKYKKPGPPYKVYHNLLLSELNVTGPMQCIVSDMTAFYVKGIYYELTIYMDLWNNEIISHSLSSKHGDRMTYISGLQDVIQLKERYPGFKTLILIKALYTHLRRLTNYYLRTISFALCPEQERLLIMMIFNMMYLNILSSLMKKDLHTF